MPLEEYRRKRSFDVTSEPRGEDAGPASEEGLRFVIHKHDATRLHYDLRLEMEGVLKSWAVPKGLATNPKARHLAVQVEDHPFSYGGFEGLIPKGEYGGGPVIVWDHGTYGAVDAEDRPVWSPASAEEILLRELQAGKIRFVLRGEKLRGQWTLVRMHDDPKNWLVLKHRDGDADPDRDPTLEDRSVVSGRTVDEVREGRAAPSIRYKGAPPAAMLATVGEPPFAQSGWTYEPKLDGIRCLVEIRSGHARLWSRRGNELSAQYPLLAEQLGRSARVPLWVDGEIVALDDGQRPSFEKLQGRMNLTRPRDIERAERDIPVLIYLFDVLEAEGRDLRGLGLAQRRRVLCSEVIPSASVLLIDSFDDGAALCEAVSQMGLEGVMAKRLESTYQSGKRSRDWLKIKPSSTERFRVVGYAPGSGRRKDTFGALLLGQSDDAGALVYAGQVGSGFDDRSLDRFRPRLEQLEQRECPVAGAPPLEKGVRWVRPELEAEVRFDSRTAVGRLRGPVFVQLHEAGGADPKPVFASTAAPDRHSETGAAQDTAPVSDDVAFVLEQLSALRSGGRLQVGSEVLPVTNLDKLLWPAHGGHPGFSKRDLLRYFARISRFALPHMRDRPLSLSRYPNGVNGGNFYQKHWRPNTPAFVETLPVWSEEEQSASTYLMCNNLATLLWMGQVADIELHTWTARRSLGPEARPGAGLDSPEPWLREDTGSSRQGVLNYPDFLVVDLDPYVYSGEETRGEEPRLSRPGFEMCCQVARWFRELLDELGLPVFLKTSGKTGLHLFVPVVRKLTYAEIRAATGSLAQHLHERHRAETTLEWSTDRRKGKIFIDVNQNSFGKTMAGVFSPRPSPQASVSIPLSWDQLGTFFPTDLDLHTAPDYVQSRGDAWADILSQKVDLAARLDD